MIKPGPSTGPGIVQKSKVKIPRKNGLNKMCHYYNCKKYEKIWI